MSIIIIAAIGNNGVIGKGNELPWEKPIIEDMANFRNLTFGKIVVMGKRTWKSLGSKPLKERAVNIILTHDKIFTAEGATIVHEKETILYLAKKQDIFIIGGTEIYSTFIPFAERMHLTFVRKNFPGDVYFPEYDEYEWETIVNGNLPIKKDTERSPYQIEYQILNRILPVRKKVAI